MTGPYAFAFTPSTELFCGLACVAVTLFPIFHTKDLTFAACRTRIVAAHLGLPVAPVDAYCRSIRQMPLVVFKLLALRIALAKLARLRRIYTCLLLVAAVAVAIRIRFDAW